MIGSYPFDLISSDVAHTRRVGVHLGHLARPGDVFLLAGELGAGKTHLTQGIAQGLGITQWVTSPSFALINEYPNGRLTLYHIDLYRLESAAEAWGLGLDEYLYGPGVSVIEWPEVALDLLPPEHLWIDLAIISDTRREIQMRPTGPRYRELVAELQTHL
ncbi:MAG: tRNA (adenosine(37)-N6)-threonylcarbamoyltransferase complex ATPase subunit type 1 TsaE [Chloroflexi bacterium]|nr:tRNA (adenosine(37)-N6)-threonylcarbamoyltransferase complex ATPase subunit type 1 TsaE [Chloroflexota bacterium]MBU1750259.1 tRNA (adenosine(37)-N6)-threonylcarbamoyltransferase complex ATPase subunit type 1 TsaE [Chloroflexota bacterium]MBU1880279.1 tRNA (adenosine(37)-N6)-threonylcarbamoyltransferase complex ATPase subunit type 1 TsaE [Chloroflexota bacterium]